MPKKEIKLIKNLSKLVKQLNQREYLHHFGPKKFKFVHHALALLLKEALKWSFRRISWLLKEFEIKVPTYSALCKCRKRIPVQLWNSLLKLTAGSNHNSVAVDSTGFSRTNPIYHYVMCNYFQRLKQDWAISKFSKIYIPSSIIYIYVLQMFKVQWRNHQKRIWLFYEKF